MAPEDATTERLRITDIHNHLFPGVDDGARDAGQAAAAIEVLRAEGVERIVTTPHFDGSLTLDPARFASRMAELDAAWERLEARASARFPNLELDRGVEVKLDVPEPDLTDSRLRLAGGPAVLVEFPHMAVPPNALRPLLHLRESGWRAIVAHAERYRGFRADLDEIEDWRSEGAAIQVNAASIMGFHGPAAYRRALRLLEHGSADCLASDYHARGEPMLVAAGAALRARGATEQARLLLDVNPRRLLAGKEPLPVQPVNWRNPILTRLLGWVRHGS